jgi:hypothetical protein
MLNDLLPVESPVYGKGGVRLGGFYFFRPFTLYNSGSLTQAHGFDRVK